MAPFQMETASSYPASPGSATTPLTSAFRSATELDVSVM